MGINEKSTDIHAEVQVAPLWDLWRGAGVSVQWLEEAAGPKNSTRQRPQAPTCSLTAQKRTRADNSTLQPARSPSVHNPFKTDDWASFLEDEMVV